MRGYIRIFGALAVVFLMLISVGPVGAQADFVPLAEAATAINIAPNSHGLVLADPQQLSLADRPAASPFAAMDARGPVPVVGELPFALPSMPSAGLVELIIGFEGHSLAAEQVYRSQAGLGLLDAEAQKEYVANLKAAQAGLIADLEALGATIVYDYQIVYNGVAILVDGSLLSGISDLRGISDIRAAKKVEPALSQSVPFIGADTVIDILGYDGTGVTIAIIDTGIDYTHASFGGSGLAADYAVQDPTTLLEPLQHPFPTAKVIGGTDLVGEFYDAGCPPPLEGIACSRIPNPDDDPLDVHGHGSHVAGIAAGIGIPAVSRGVAPGASLLAIKVFALGSTSNAVLLDALEFALDPNGDGDISDHADVINMSLGSPFSRESDPVAVATNFVVDLGVVVVASAGNEGDISYVTGGPSVATKAISVAAGNDPGIEAQLVTASGTDGADGDYKALEAVFTPPLSGIGVLTGDTAFVGDACSAFAAGSLSDMIPLIIRGACRFDAKIRNVEDAGAIAAVIYNNQPGAAPILMGGDPALVTIPGFMISNPAGELLAPSLVPGSAFTLDPANLGSAEEWLQGFTSRGPRFGDSYLKPDITAPGGEIHSVWVGSGNGGVDAWGTSMASPHVAGAAALLMELHPDWSPAKVKAALMNTAADAHVGGTPYPLSRMGAGRVQVDEAADLESLVLPSSVSFGVKQSDRWGKKLYSERLRLHNNGDHWKVYVLHTDFLYTDDDEGSIKFMHRNHVYVKPDRSKSIRLKLLVDFKKLDPESSFEEYEAFLTVKEVWPGDDEIRVPIHIIPYARAKAHAYPHVVKMPYKDYFKVKNRGLSATEVDIYQFGGSDPNEDLILEAPGFPEDPDDWFDVRRFGAHAWDWPGVGRILEFATVTHGMRSAASMMLTEVYLWVDDDPVPDYLVWAVDIGLFFSGVPDGFLTSIIWELSSGFGWTQFSVRDDLNTAIQAVPVFLDSPFFISINLIGEFFGTPTIDEDDPDFVYSVLTWDLETLFFDFTDFAYFNAINPILDADPQYFVVDRREKVKVDVLASEEGKLLVLYYNNKAAHKQSQIIKVWFGDGHCHWDP